MKPICAGSCVILVCLVSGCGTLAGSKAKVSGKQIEGVNYIDFPSERRGAWVIQESVVGNVRVCAEPFSDTGISTEQLISFAAKLPKEQGSADGSMHAISNLVELKGRTPAVLAMRDVMYRMCERRIASAEGSIPKEELDIYADIVKIIGQFASADRADAEARQASITTLSIANSKFSRAKEAQDRGFELLAQCKWKEAESSFSKAEDIYPQFQASYEMAGLLRVSAGNEKKAVLERGTAYMTDAVRKKVEMC